MTAYRPPTIPYHIPLHLLLYFYDLLLATGHARVVEQSI
jgi:hypothetical protein